MSADCRYCGGTGKARRIAVVGEPLPQDQMGAQHKIQDAVRPADHVVCFSDFGQMVSAGANHTHARERDKPIEEMGDFDEVIDIGPPKDAGDKASDKSEAAKIATTPASRNPPPESMTPGALGGGPPPKVPGDDELKRRASRKPGE